MDLIRSQLSSPKIRTNTSTFPQVVKDSMNLTCQNRTRVECEAIHSFGIHANICNLVSRPQLGSMNNIYLMCPYQLHFTPSQIVQVSCCDWK